MGGGEGRGVEGMGGERKGGKGRGGEIERQGVVMKCYEKGEWGERGI